nr:zinc finger, CCHC-type [Tanacetum cinerariifolium]
MWVYFLKSKDEALETFKEFKLKVENKVGKKLKSFRTDRGVTKPHLKKLDDRSKELAYLGTQPGSKAYRLFDPITKDMVVSRDVKFKEDEGWDWKDSAPSPIQNNAHDDISDDDEIKQPIDNPSTPPPYTYEPNSEDSTEHTSSIASSSRPLDHTPVRGYRNLSKIYNRAPEVQSNELLLLEEEPRNYKEVAQDKKWIKAMQIEIDSINKNKTWKLATLPDNQKAIGLKWVFKTKRDGNGNIIKHKARLVAKGYVQEHGIDYDEVFAPVARMETIRLILALLAYHGWEVHHLDVKSAFLHGELKEEVYVTQPEGFKKPGNENKVYRLVKALYGLKQAPLDDCTRFMWAYFLTSKDQAFSTFKEFRQQIEMEMRMKLRMLRINRGGEFTSNEFTKYYKENGIARLLTTPYSPQQNGVVEKRNRIVLSTTRSMMKAMKLPLTFWAEAVRHAIYILNRVPTRALEDKTPYEALYNRKTNMENLRIFGCTAYAKITISHLKKLDDISIPLRKHVSRDVKFMETEPWDWNKDDTSTQDTFWDGFMVEGVDNENTIPVNTEINDKIDDTYQEQDPISDPNSPITTPTYTYNPHSEEEEEATTSSTKNSGNRFHDTPVRGFKDLAKIYENTHEVEIGNLLLMEEEPRNYKEASTDKKWIEAIEIELDSINKNNTWTLTTLPPDQKAIGLKWVYKTKRNEKGKIIKYKARLVAKEYVQEHGIDFDEVFAPVARIETVRLILTLAAYHGWQKQPIVALSSCESEFMAATGAACQALWLKRLLSELARWEEERISLKVDNILAITLVRNPIFHGRNADGSLHACDEDVGSCISMVGLRNGAAWCIRMKDTQSMEKFFDFNYTISLLAKKIKNLHNKRAICLYVELNQSNDSEQPVFVTDTFVDFLSDVNVISYTPYADNNKHEFVQIITSLAQNDVGILFLIDNVQHDVTRCNTVNQETNQVNETLVVELERYREKVKNIGNTKEPQLMFPSREKDLDSQL